MEEFDTLKREIELIKTRNKRVELDKAWETSWTRRLFISISTYFLISIFLFSVGNNRPLLNAIIPAVAYLLSTASLQILKNFWIRK